MLEQFNPRPDDTVELPAVPSSSQRTIIFMIIAGVVAIGVLVGVGFLAFGTLGSGGGGGGIAAPGLPAVSPPSNEPSTDPTDTATPTQTATPAAVATPTAAAIKVTVANPTMHPASYQGANCPGSTTAAVTVVVSAPVTITYHWMVADQAGAPATATFAGAGSRQFSLPLQNITIPNGQIHVSFTVTAPVTRVAGAVYTQKCGASVSAISKKQDLKTCEVVLSATLKAGVGPMTVRFHWVINGTSLPGDLRSQWLVPAGGGSTVVNRTVSDRTRVNAVLVVESPVHTQTKPVTAMCLTPVP
jgi:hypothetical protein